MWEDGRKEFGAVGGLGGHGGRDGDGLVAVESVSGLVIDLFDGSSVVACKGFCNGGDGGLEAAEGVVDVEGKVEVGGLVMPDEDDAELVVGHVVGDERRTAPEGADVGNGLGDAAEGLAVLGEGGYGVEDGMTVDWGGGGRTEDDGGVLVNVVDNGGCDSHRERGRVRATSRATTRRLAFFVAETPATEDTTPRVRLRLLAGAFFAPGWRCPGIMLKQH